MRIENATGQWESVSIYDGAMPPNRGTLDPVTLHLRDLGGRGQVVVECFGQAWACYFGAIGGGTLRRFVAGLDADYLRDKMTAGTGDSTKREEAYALHIARAVIEACRSSEWVDNTVSNAGERETLIRTILGLSFSYHRALEQAAHQTYNEDIEPAARKAKEAFESELRAALASKPAAPREVKP